MKRVLASAALAGFLLVLGGCAKEWHRIREEGSVRIQTEVVVHTDPPGADVTVNGERRGATPVRIPFIYRYRKVIWGRRVSYGVYREPEERMVPEYFNNIFDVELVKPGFELETHELMLRGEKEKEFHVTLKPMER
jgi:hypothetical protein